MNTLLLHTALNPGGVLLWGDYSERVAFLEKNSPSEHLLASIHQVLEKASLTLSQIDRYAITVGPGSFTGIRVGISTLKALARVHPKPVVPISTLLLQATCHLQSGKIIASALTARQQEVYTALYQEKEGSTYCLLPECWMELKDLFEEMRKQDQSFIGVGEPFETWKGLIPQDLDLSIVGGWVKDYFPERELIQVTELLDLQGLSIPASKLTAQYLRPSEAEMRLRG